MLLELLNVFGHNLLLLQRLQIACCISSHWQEQN